MLALLPSKLSLALEAVLYIAYHGRFHPVSSSELSEQLRFPDRYLEHPLQRLSRAGILRSIRGPKGGYVLATDRETLTLGSLCRLLLEGEEPHSKASSVLGSEILHPVLQQAETRYLDSLEKTTIDHLCREAHKRKLAMETAKPLDFSI